MSTSAPLGKPTTALITPSYWADFDSCRLLCDSIDAYLSTPVDHYLLVDNHDYQLFQQLAGPHRFVVNEQDILPSWLHSVRQGLSSSARKIWFSTRTWPMRGWHVQQLRRIAMAQHLTHDGLLYCDSDMLFVREFSTESLWNGDDLRLYRKDNGIHDQLPDGGKLHQQWTGHAARLNGLAAPSFPAHDYINNMVTWRRQSVVDMCAHIEAITGKHWVAAIASQRSFSECQIYGAYADGLNSLAGHFLGQGGLCKTYWSGNALTAEQVKDFVAAMDANQVAIGIQSFTGTDPNLLRQLIAA